MKRAALSPRDFLACLLKTAYLPEELPPTVTSREYSDFCRRNYKVVRAQKDQLIKLATHYDTYTAPRNVSGRRLDAGVKLLRSKLLRGDGDNKARSPGRARRKPLKPFACGNAG